MRRNVISLTDGAMASSMLPQQGKKTGHTDIRQSERTGLAIQSLFLFVICVIMLNAVVLPNAQQTLLASAIGIGALLALCYNQKFNTSAIMLFASSWIVTLFYMMVGAFDGAPDVALAQTIAIYIVSPLLWILVIDRTWRLVGIDTIVRGFGVLAILAAVSVGIYMFLFLNFGPQAVSFFGVRPNVHIEDGYSGAVLHVSGSLIYLGAAFVASPGVLNSKKFGFIVIFSIALASIASGRTLAILGLLIGGTYYFISEPRKVFPRLIVMMTVFIIIGLFVTFTMDYLLGVDVFQLLERHFNKVAGGDVERPAQIAALLRGAENNWFLGSGHGIGVDYIRSNTFPWRYESVIVALLFKLGILGLLVVMMPVIYSLFILFKKQLFGNLDKYDSFFGASLIAVMLAAMTNPYPEAFAFQWMYLVPIYYFVSKRSSGKNSHLQRSEERKSVTI